MEYFIYAVRVFSNDLPEAVDFYRSTLGLNILERADSFAVFDLGGVNLIVEQADDKETRAMVGRFSGISISSSDVMATYDKLMARGVEFLSPPIQQDWGGQLAHFFDPDGNVISLVR